MVCCCCVPLSPIQSSAELFKAQFGYAHIVLTVIAVVLSALYGYSKHWILNNMLGEAFATSAVALLNLDSFKTGMALLSGLFFYDIFWVFGTDVMVTVAKNFEAPIKVVFPKDIFEVVQNGILTTPSPQFTMLGLGDIVIPGIFFLLQLFITHSLGIYIALCLQFDYYLSQKPKTKKHSIYFFPKPYFNACFTAYVIGLLTTVFVMHTFKAAQVTDLLLRQRGCLHL